MFRCRLLLAVLATLVGSCGRAHPTESKSLYFRGEAVGQVDETVDGRTVSRKTALHGGAAASAGIQSELTATLDSQGFVTAARYQRAGQRTVAFDGTQLIDERGSRLVLQNTRVVLLDVLPRVVPRSSTEVSIVDLSSGEVLPGRVERRGAIVVALDAAGAEVARARSDGLRIGPGAFAEGDAPPHTSDAAVEPAFDGRTLDGVLVLGGIEALRGALQLEGPGAVPVDDDDRALRVLMLPAHRFTAPPLASERLPGLFLQSAAPEIIAFARRHARGASALEDARTIALAVHPLVNADRRDKAPSALSMLARGGDCDSAAALVTAALRALGHAARPVVGYRLVDAGGPHRLTPHAWVEVYTGHDWQMVDATLPGVGVLAGHLKLFHGLGGALTMGRVLGRLTPWRAVLSEAQASTSAPLQQ